MGLEVMELITLEALSAAPPTALDAPPTSDEAELAAPPTPPATVELTPETLAPAPLAELVMATELEIEERTPASRELEAEGAEMVVESEPEAD